MEAGEDEKNLRELLTNYITVLTTHEQKEEAELVRHLLRDWRTAFVRAVPKKK